MDKTNRVIKICRRIEEIEYLLECKDRMLQEAEELRYEKEALEVELDNLQVAN